MNEPLPAERRYQSMYFPAYLGNPLETNSFLVAWCRAWLKVIGGAAEGRIVDRKTGKHHVI